MSALLLVVLLGAMDGEQPVPGTLLVGTTTWVHDGGWGPGTVVTNLDGGVSFGTPLYRSCAEAPPLEPVDGGFFLPELRARRLSCLLTTCETDRLEKARFISDSTAPLPWWAWAMGMSLTLGLGVLLGRLIP